MYPDLFGIPGFTMNVFMILAVASALILAFIYLKKKGLKKESYLDFAILLIATLVVGIISTILFENIYEGIKHAVNHEPQAWTWSMTFYGGLFGGVATFLLVYFLYYVKHNPPFIKDVLVIAPASISLGHAIGRIGCFFNGCCYGKETDEWYGVLFPGHAHKVIPTQIFEMIFLFVLAAALIFIAFKGITKYTFVIYMIAYAIFRFILEFFRGDERGQLNGLSPSQYWCIIMFVGAFILIYFYKKMIFKNEKEVEA